LQITYITTTFSRRCKPLSIFTPQAKKGNKEILSLLLENKDGLTSWEIAKKTGSNTISTQSKNSSLSRPLKKLTKGGYIIPNEKKYLLTFKGFLVTLTFYETSNVPEEAAEWLKILSLTHTAIGQVSTFALERQKFKYDSGIVNMFQLTAKYLLSEGFDFNGEENHRVIEATVAHILNTYVNSREENDCLIGFVNLNKPDIDK
jgi:hypothetical protein